MLIAIHAHTYSTHLIPSLLPTKTSDLTLTGVSPPPEIKDVLTKGKLDADCLYDCLVPNITDSGNELDRGKIGVSSLHIGMGL